MVCLMDWKCLAGIYEHEGIEVKHCIVVAINYDLFIDLYFYYSYEQQAEGVGT